MILALMLYINVLATLMLCRYISVWGELAQLILICHPVQISIQGHILPCAYTIDGRGKDSLNLCFL